MSTEKTTKVPQATKLRDLALKELDLFHSPDEAAYVTLPNGATHRVNSKAMRRWLIRKNGGCPSMTTVQAAITAIEAEAIDDRPEHAVFVRLGWQDDSVYLDLKDRFVKISPGKWEIVNTVPVKFRRPETMLRLPEPMRGGSLNQLRSLVNVPDGDNWMLLVSWLLGALNPRGPYPILAFHGEKGSGKSTASRYLRSLIDPSILDTAKAPQDIDTLNIRAQKTWIIAYDNITSIPQWLSDALCRMSSGAGDSKRALYTDDDETVFKYMRPGILNGITEYATQADLLNRTVSVTLEPMRGSRRTEEELDQRFAEVQPYILGALLDAARVAMVTKVANDTDWPRMADFAKWVVASGQWERKTFLSAYDRNQKDADWLAVESSVVAMAVIKFMEDRRYAAEHGLADLDGKDLAKTTWSGTATQLKAELERLALPKSGYMNSHTEYPPNWPKVPKRLSDELIKVAGPLRKVAGIDVEIGHSHDHEHNRQITITLMQEQQQVQEPAMVQDTLPWAA